MKIKDSYNGTYALFLSEKIASVYPAFDSVGFISKIKNELEDQEYTARMQIFVDALDVFMPEYSQSLGIFTEILGPELNSPADMYSAGGWLAPIGKYVERHAEEDFDATVTFIEQLTKRYTGEFAMRPLIAAFSERSMAVIDGWSRSDSLYVRRMSSECMRISLPWAKKLTAAVECFDEYSAVLTRLNNDPDPYVRRSVANNLNDLSKYSMEKFKQIVNAWMANNPTEHTLWIIQHGSRTIRKKARKETEQ